MHEVVSDSKSHGDISAPGSPSRKSLLALDGLNFFMTDITGGVGPFLAIYLKTTLHLDPAQIGFAMSASDICSILAQTPAGAFVDWFKNKRLILVVGSIFIAVCSMTLAFKPAFTTVVAAQIAIGFVRAFFPPTVAAITLGLVGQKAFAKRTGRNSALDHSGNLLAALLCGIVSKIYSMAAIFFMIAATSLSVLPIVLAINPKEIDQDAACGKESLEGASAEVRGRSFFSTPLIIFIGCVVLFHFANAAMLPQVGQKVAETKIMHAGLCMSACIIVAQLVMIPTAVLASRFAADVGRKPVFLLGFISLPLRAILFALNNNPYALIASQILDGIGAGIFGVLSLIVIADLTKGSGRFNLAQGVLATAVGIGAALSNLIIGLIVNRWGYNVGFFVLAGIATVATVSFALMMPETRDLRSDTVDKKSQSLTSD